MTIWAVLAEGELYAVFDSEAKARAYVDERWAGLEDRWEWARVQRRVVRS